MTRESCYGCIYLCPITDMYPTEKNCHYLLMTGQPRACDASYCNKKVVAEQYSDPRPKAKTA